MYIYLYTHIHTHTTNLFALDLLRSSCSDDIVRYGFSYLGGAPSNLAIRGSDCSCLNLVSCEPITLMLWLST